MQNLFDAKRDHTHHSLTSLQITTNFLVEYNSIQSSWRPAVKWFFPLTKKICVLWLVQYYEILTNFTADLLALALIKILRPQHGLHANNQTRPPLCLICLALLNLCHVRQKLNQNDVPSDWKYDLPIFIYGRPYLFQNQIFAKLL